MWGKGGEGLGTIMNHVVNHVVKVGDHYEFCGKGGGDYELGGWV